MTELMRDVNDTIITPALRLLPRSMDSREARVMLLAIGMQESRLRDRWQIVDRRRPEVRGPARGLWQFERGGGVTGVLNHSASRALARELCGVRGVVPAPSTVWTWLAEDDVLAAGFARLLLWTDPRPLPRLGQPDAAWGYYMDNWRPGKPHRRTWGAFYRQALEVIAPGAPA